MALPIDGRGWDGKVLDSRLLAEIAAHRLQRGNNDWARGRRRLQRCRNHFAPGIAERMNA
ncbi:MAG: hypothetical protein J0M00_00765 [Burkholderiales bacterium]|nr:hypothetical protein [Burkholderiales bacterium]